MNSTVTLAIISREAKRLRVRIRIPNARKVYATIDMSGETVNHPDFEASLEFYNQYLSRTAESSSVAMVFRKNAIRSVATKPNFQNSIGLRQSGDELLHFESRNVTNISRFPSRSFQYVGGNDTRITYVGFSFNVVIFPKYSKTFRV